MLRLGSIYHIVRDFAKSVSFYEKFLDMPVSSKNMGRFAQFEFHGKNISLMNGYFDRDNPDKTIHSGEYTPEFDELAAIADAENSRKSVMNFWCDDLRAEHERVRALNIADDVTGIRYVFNVAPYYYFQLSDPDGNVIEITGSYVPDDGEFDGGAR